MKKIKAIRTLSIFYPPGLTLVELLVALVVTSIVLAAVATLAFAMSSANDSADDTILKQAQLRSATIRISELIRHCKLICATLENDLAVWRADDNNDCQINVNELVYIETGPERNYLRLCDFFSSENPGISLSTVKDSITKSWLESTCEEKHVLLLPQCSNVQINLDTTPPRTKCVSILFELTENGIIRQYQINSHLRSWAGNLLNQSADSLVSDDD